MNYHKLWLIGVATAALAAHALASGWTVSVTVSQGQLFPGGGTVDVPFTIDGNPFSSAPATYTVNALPKITFLTLASAPPITVGNGTPYTFATFTGVYTVQGGASKAPLTGFTWVVSGFVFDYGQIIGFKKVVDLDTSEVLFTGDFVVSGAAYSGGANGVFTLTQSFNLSNPSNNFIVFEVFLVHIDGAPAPGTSTASLLLVEQDWVPEPASLLVLGTGLVGLMLRRRKR